MKRARAIFILAFALSGCAKPGPLPTGAVNAVDAGLNENLQAAHAAIVQYQADVAAGKHVPTASEKTLINATIAALNTADTLYCGAPAPGQPCATTSFHAQLLLNPNAGESPDLAAAISTVTANINQILALIKGA
jgi:hypothetical protein